MILDTDTISRMSNQALFSMISNKKQTIEGLQAKGTDTKEMEIEFCYLVRERQRRFYRKKSYPASVID